MSDINKLKKEAEELIDRKFYNLVRAEVDLRDMRLKPTAPSDPRSEIKIILSEYLDKAWEGGGFETATDLPNRWEKSLKKEIIEEIKKRLLDSGIFYEEDGKWFIGMNEDSDCTEQIKILDTI